MTTFTSNKEQKSDKGITAFTGSSTADQAGDSKRASSSAAEIKSEEKAVDMEEFYANNFVFEEGTLTEAILTAVPPREVLTSQEEAEIRKAKKELDDITKELKEEKEKCRVFFDTLKRKDCISVIRIQDSKGRVRTGTVKDIQERCKTLQKDALEFAYFLDDKAQRLLQARQFKRAQNEYEIILNCLIETYGDNNSNTLKARLNYGISLLSDGCPESAALLVQEMIAKLKKELAELQEQESSSSVKDVKKSIAIGCYSLAQYYFNKNELELAAKFLTDSEKLRKEYGAPESELDRMQFLSGQINYRNGNKPEALKKMADCYNFRCDRDMQNGDLIPVLEVLIRMMEDEKNVPQQFRFLSHLLGIKKHLNFNTRDIVNIQLRLLNVMQGEVSDKEYFSLMDDIEARLHKIPVTEESVDVGFSYLQLIEAKMIFLPQDWSNVKKKNYHVELSKIIYKANAHLNAGNDKNAVAAALKRLEVLREASQRAIEFFGETPPYLFMGDGKPSHPEDKAEFALRAAPDNDEPAAESSTKEHLITLSDFSSEVRHSLVDEADRILTVEEFNKLPDEGSINPYKLRTAQAGTSPTFGDGKPLSTTKQVLVEDPSYTKNIPPVEIGIHDGEIYSFDTRRLIVHQQAREENPAVLVRYKKIFGDYLQKRIAKIYSPRPWNGLVTALRRGEVNSESEPYINPVLRKQLDDIVSKEFKSYPSQRKSTPGDHRDDENGFPIVKQKAKKIHEYLKKRAKKGSKSATAVLKELKKIHNSKGRDAAYDYLLNKKKELQSAPKSEMKAERKQQPETKSSPAKTAATAGTAGASSSVSALTTTAVDASPFASSAAGDSYTVFASGIAAGSAARVGAGIASIAATVAAGGTTAAGSSEIAMDDGAVLKGVASVGVQSRQKSPGSRG